MGFKSLFTRKKKLIPKSRNTTADATVAIATTSILSRSPSFSAHSRAQLAAELEHVFKKFDVNGDGKISSSELGSIMGSLGQVASEEELEIMIREVDADGDGFINLQEFIELNTQGVDSEEVLENLKDAFSVFDIDGNGSITAEELHMVMESLGDACSVEECRQMISAVDSDGDGMIDFEEFRVMMMMGTRFESMEKVKSEM